MMSNLDVNTDRGRETLREEENACSLFERRYDGYKYFNTPKTTAADIDAVICKGNTAVAIAETKCRSETLDIFKGRYMSEWLLTHEKLFKGKQISDALQVSFLGLIYLVPSRCLLVSRLYTPKDGWLVRFRVEKSWTRATCNGGMANRDNAYIDISNAEIIT